MNKYLAHHHYIFLVFIFLILFASCSKERKLQKSKDYNLIYQKALEYYAKKKYIKALPLLEEVIPIYKLTERGESVYYYYSYCHYHIKEYYTAAFYFKTFAKTYPNSKYAEECLYMSAICNVKTSPPNYLDQKETITAINELQMFLNKYPESSKKDTCNQIIDKLRSKLEKKAFQNAYQYYHMEQYRSASVALKAMLEEYPLTSYMEEALYLIVKSDYLYAANSIDSKKKERFEECIKSYLNFVGFFPKSKKLKELESLYSNALSMVKRFDN
jgi:outer membrane protein assembly factor BamD